MSEPFHYFDLQVNGYAGVDFNQDALAGADLRRAWQRLREDGVDGVLATVVTDQLPRIEARLGANRRDPSAGPTSCARGGPRDHVEGPFISGTDRLTSAQSIRPRPSAPPTSSHKAAPGRRRGLVRLVTLAPDAIPGMKVIRHLAEANILVSAGHCDPSLDELHAAIDAGSRCSLIWATVVRSCSPGTTT